MYLFQVCTVFAIILALIHDLTINNNIKGKGLPGIHRINSACNIILVRIDSYAIFVVCEQAIDLKVKQTVNVS